MIAQKTEGKLSSSLCRRIRRHRRAFLTYDRLAPIGDRLDQRFAASGMGELDFWQVREAERRHSLLAHPVRSFADVRAKARYLLGYSGNDFLISGEQDVALFLGSMVPANTNESKPGKDESALRQAST